MAEKTATKKKAVKAPKKATDGAFAVIETGGKQYVVRAGDTLKIEKLELNAGDKVSFDKVLLQSDGSTATVGAPYISGAKVSGTVKSQGRHAKVIVMKYKAKSRYLKKNGHRQPFTEVEIVSV